MGNDDPQTQEIAQNKNRAVQRAVQNCHDLCPIIAHKENSGNLGNNSVTPSGVVQLPGPLFCQRFGKLILNYLMELHPRVQVRVKIKRRGNDEREIRLAHQNDPEPKNENTPAIIAPIPA